MAMIESEDQKFFATERYTCKSTAFVATINKFGHAEGFEYLLNLIKKPETSLNNLNYIVSFFAKSQAMYHRQFVDDYYDRFQSAVKDKLLSATSQ